MPAAGLRGMAGDLAAWDRALSGASFLGLLRLSNQGFSDGCHTPMDNG